MDELEMLRRKKLEELKKKYMERESMSDAPDKPIEVNDGNFEEFVKKYKNVVIDCWAPWCGPCLIIHPIVEELAKEYKGRIAFGKLNVDENPQTAMKYSIMSIPTLLVFKDGKFVDRIIGAMPKEMLVGKLKMTGII